MPTFKQSRYIEESIDSILTQSYKDIELIVVPVFQDKKVIDVLKKVKDKRVKIILSNYALITHQMNLGALASSGKYFMIFASDDVLLPGSLEALLKTAVEQKASVVYPDFYIGSKYLRKKKEVKSGEHSLERINRECYITDVSFCRHKHFIKHLPMKFSSGKNRIWNVWKDISNDKTISHLKKSTFIYRQHGKSVHSTNSQGDFIFVRNGSNVNMKEIYKKLPMLKGDVKKKHYCIYFPDPAVFIENRKSYKYKRIILHWDNDNIKLLDKIVDLKYVHNVTHDSGVLSLLRSKKAFNVEFIKDPHDLLDYLTEERY